MSQYYYLLSSLPELEIGKDSYKIDFEEVYQFIYENLHSDDKELFKYLLYPGDNKNLINEIAQNIGSPAPFPQFFEPSALTREQIGDYEKKFDQFPDYMSRFIENKVADLSGKSLVALEKELNQHFYEEVLELSDEFLEEYYAFEKALQQILLAINNRHFDLEALQQLPEDDFIVNNLKKSSAADFGLGQDYDFIENLNQIVEQGNVEQLEMQVERIRWDYLEELTKFSFFDSHKVFTYTLKLLSLKRWMSLVPEAGKKRLEELIDHKMEAFELPSI